MHTPPSRVSQAARAVLAALLLSTSMSIACRDDEPDRDARSAGGENALDRAGRKVDRAHRNFQREVEPAADFVDEKTKKVVEEGKKAVKKSADAVEEAVD
jgi:hypothetical protein